MPNKTLISARQGSLTQQVSVDSSKAQASVTVLKEPDGVARREQCALSQERENKRVDRCGGVEGHAERK